jgi:hypothetical protein
LWKNGGKRQNDNEAKSIPPTMPPFKQEKAESIIVHAKETHHLKPKKRRY